MSRHYQRIYPTYQIVVEEEPPGSFLVVKLGSPDLLKNQTGLCVAYAKDFETSKGYAEKFPEYYEAAQLKGYAVHNDESQEAVFSHPNRRSLPVQTSLSMPIEEFKKLISG